jgi:hypothetical protein
VRFDYVVPVNDFIDRTEFSNDFGIGQYISETGLCATCMCDAEEICLFDTK